MLAEAYVAIRGTTHSLNMQRSHIGVLHLLCCLGILRATAAVMWEVWGRQTAPASSLRVRCYLHWQL